MLQFLKGVSRIADDVGEDHEAMGELRRALALYLDDLRGRSPTSTGPG